MVAHVSWLMTFLENKEHVVFMIKILFGNQQDLNIYPTYRLQVPLFTGFHSYASKNKQYVLQTASLVYFTMTWFLEPFYI